MNTLPARCLLVLALAAAAAPARAAVSAADFAGEWAWEDYNPSMQPEADSITLAVAADGTLSGSVRYVAMTEPVSQVAVSGDTVTFQSPLPHSLTGFWTLDLDGTLTVQIPGLLPAGMPPRTYAATHTGAPVITHQAAFMIQIGTYHVGDIATATVTATGATSYQWRRDGTDLAGATTATLTLPNVQLADQGAYTCLIRNASAPILSHGAVLTVEALSSGGTTGGGGGTFIPPPGFLTPLGLSVINPTTDYAGPPSAEGTAEVLLYPNGTSSPVVRDPVAVTTGTGNTLLLAAGNGLRLQAGATGARPIQAQWTFNGKIIIGAQDDHLAQTFMDAAGAGTYGCTVTNALGSDHWAVTVTVVPVPQITASPAGVTVAPGQPFTLSAAASSVTAAAPLTFQWYHDGAAIAGATAATLRAGGAGTDGTSTYTVAAAGAADAGTYTCVATNAVGTATTAAATVALLAPGRIVNLSTRVLAGGAAGSPICGFVIAGNAGMPVALRAVGPSLANFGITDALPNPWMALMRPDGTKTTSHGWVAGDGPRMAAVGAFPLNSGSTDTAYFDTLAPAAYTAVITDGGGGHGVVMLEAYDASAGTGAERFVNASTRGYVGQGGDVMITGFVVAGDLPVKVLVRAVGPTLAGFGVGDALTDPQLQLVHAGATVATNDNWQTGNDVAALAAAENTVQAFPLPVGSKDAALLITLGAGAYTATVSGVGGATGTAMVELYVMP